MDKVRVVRWMAIGLHGIVFLFALFVTFTLAEGDLLGVLARAGTDVVLRQALSLSALLIVGNFLGVILLLTPLYMSFRGSCALVAYEVVFLGVSFLFLSLDYSVIVGVVTIALFYIAYMRRNVIR
jgi:hypothetical protein